MTDRAEVRRLLLSSAGGYLRNPLRSSGITCGVCTTPVQGHRVCWPCAQAQSHTGLAELVVPLTYGVGGTQSGMLLRHYKDDPVTAVRVRHTTVLRRLLYLALTGHESCIGRRVGAPVTRRMVVPSLRARPGPHPLAVLAEAMGAVHPGPGLRAAPGVTGERVISADQFCLGTGDSVAGAHVLLLDDTWTTGSRAQSAALSLHRAGAAAVTVLVLGRWLAPEYGANAGFVAEHLRGDYDPERCPVTGGACP